MPRQLSKNASNGSVEFRAHEEGKYAMFLITKYLTMMIPEVQGNTPPNDFFIYSACDNNYFDEFALPLINSIKRNVNLPLHLHIFNPRAQQIELCNKLGVTVSWEDVPLDLFDRAADRFIEVPTKEPMKSEYERTLNAMGKGQDKNIMHRLQKTYYACARFFRLAGMYSSQGVFAIDVDAVVRRPWHELKNNCDLYIHRIEGRRARFMAGGLYLNPGVPANMFIQTYANSVRAKFNNNYIYWGLDQDLLESAVPKYNWIQLPESFIDWNMKPDSYIWTAKGTRKDHEKFINEKQKYST